MYLTMLTFNNKPRIFTALNLQNYLIKSMPNKKKKNNNKAYGVILLHSNMKKRI